MTTLHERLRFLRKQAHLTLKDVADRSDISFTFLSDIECGRTMPSLYTLERIADVYGLAVGEALVNVRIKQEGGAS
jgi:transcriptional regulator with XRE-family HTH domain